MSRAISTIRIRKVLQQRIDACDRAVAHYIARRVETGDETYEHMAISERCSASELRHVHRLLLGEDAL